MYYVTKYYNCINEHNDYVCQGLIHCFDCFKGRVRRWIQ